MSDDEEVYSEEEEEEEEVIETKTEQPSGDPEFIKKQDQKRSDLDEQLREYIQEWRKQRAKEEDELKRLKEKQAKRKVTRAEEEKKLAERKKQEEERRQREIEEKKQKDIEEKRLRLEEAEKKRQAMLQAMNAANKKGPNFTVTKKDPNAANLSPAQIERNKTKEQLEEEKKISLSIRIKPLSIDGLGVEKLREKAAELWQAIVKLETEKYDLEERQKRQDYDLKELKERQKQQLRHKALKKGLDPEALTGKYPPKIQVASKYERRVDTRSYGDKKKLFEGGYEDIVKETNEKNWKEKFGQFDSRQKIFQLRILHYALSCTPTARLPKWFGERPGKKTGDPESPEGEEEKQVVEEDDIKEPVYEPEPEEEEEEEEIEEEEEEEDEEEEE
ncbi:troponin T, skeletal muscle isoform X3 [Dendroctonus ponderosae]|uniref:troponin T, skeletal muscle isoform X3 n=1 Tax=Dendroctonus ponderosae TaxID=77166 RepID=UPI002035BA6A|nr:troponin T, skeletal muscle isoform X3 [Dendroctonus ponderosae]